MKKITAMTLLFVFALVVPAMAQDGAALFATKCAACHGKTGAGDTSIAKAKGIKDLGSADVQKLTDDQLTSMIASGGEKKTAGHAFKTKGLSDDDIKALVTFIRSLKK